MSLFRLKKRIHLGALWSGKKSNRVVLDRSMVGRVAVVALVAAVARCARGELLFHSSLDGGLAVDDSGNSWDTPCGHLSRRVAPANDIFSRVSRAPAPSPDPTGAPS